MGVTFAKHNLMRSKGYSFILSEYIFVDRKGTADFTQVDWFGQDAEWLDTTRKNVNVCHNSKTTLFG